MRWRLIIEEFGPTFDYIPGAKNIVEDAFISLETINNCNKVNTDLYTIVQNLINLEANIYDEDKTASVETLADQYSMTLDDLPEDALPVTYKHILYINNRIKMC